MRPVASWQIDVIPSSMHYALDDQELAELKSLEVTPRFHAARMLLVVFRTDPEVVRAALPRQLSPVEQPLGVAFVAEYGSTNFGLTYREAGLALRCRLGREDGLHHLCMPVDDEIALIGGRESFGFPKKLADSITLGEDDDRLTGSVVRRGTELLRISATPKSPASADDLGAVFERDQGALCSRSFLFKFFPAPNGKSLDYFPRVVRQQTAVEPLQVRTVDAKLELASSPLDPWAEFPVHGIETAIEGTFDLTLHSGKVVRRVWNVLKFLPHLFYKNDTLALLRAAKAKTP